MRIAEKEDGAKVPFQHGKKKQRQEKKNIILGRESFRTIKKWSLRVGKAPPWRNEKKIEA